MNDFKRKIKKNILRKKKTIQDEKDLTAEEGKKESEKQKEFGQMDVKQEDSKEVKTALQEEDGEEDAPEIEGAREDKLQHFKTKTKKNI